MPVLAGISSGPARGTMMILSRRHRMMAAGASGATRKSMGMSAVSHNSLATNAEGLKDAEHGEAGSHNGSRMSLGVVNAGEAGRSSLLAVDEGEKKGHEQLNWAAWWQVQFQGLKDIFLNYLNILLIFVPIGQYCHLTEMESCYTFTANFLAIIPLASILGSATEAISEHTGQLFGGLLNATFGNAVEMIMCIQAVKAGLIQVVQGNLFGYILSNLLLVLGMAICASGLLRKTQQFNAPGAAANMTCQAVASISVCLPTMFRGVVNSTDYQVLMISRVCSIFLMAVYGLFLFFQLKTHSDLFTDDSQEDEQEGQLAPSISVVLLFLCTMTVAVCSGALVDSIEDVSKVYGLPKAFIGVILLPIVGNAAEHATAVTCAYKGMMDLALGVAVGLDTDRALRGALRGNVRLDL